MLKIYKNITKIIMKKNFIIFLFILLLLLSCFYIYLFIVIIEHLKTIQDLIIIDICNFEEEIEEFNRREKPYHFITHMGTIKNDIYNGVKTTLPIIIIGGTFFFLLYTKNLFLFKTLFEYYYPGALTPKVHHCHIEIVMEEEEYTNGEEELNIKEKKSNEE
jgi:hypothetical protein